MQRMRVWDTRLAVTFATQPVLHVMRAFATSSWPPRRDTPHGLHVHRLAADDVVEDVEIVDHEIHHDAYVLGARAVGGETMHLDVERLFAEAIGRRHDGVEALDVADLQ